MKREDGGEESLSGVFTLSLVETRGHLGPAHLRPVVLGGDLGFSLE